MCVFFEVDVHMIVVFGIISFCSRWCGILVCCANGDNNDIFFKNTMRNRSNPSQSQKEKVEQPKVEALVEFERVETLVKMLEIVDKTIEVDRRKSSSYCCCSTCFSYSKPFCIFFVVIIIFKVLLGVFFSFLAFVISQTSILFYLLYPYISFIILNY